MSWRSAIPVLIRRTSIHPVAARHYQDIFLLHLSFLWHLSCTKTTPASLFNSTMFPGRLRPLWRRRSDQPGRSPVHLGRDCSMKRKRPASVHRPKCSSLPGRRGFSRADWHPSPKKDRTLPGCFGTGTGMFHSGTARGVVRSQWTRIGKKSTFFRVRTFFRNRLQHSGRSGFTTAIAASNRVHSAGNGPRQRHGSFSGDLLPRHVTSPINVALAAVKTGRSMKGLVDYAANLTVADRR